MNVEETFTHELDNTYRSLEAFDILMRDRIEQVPIEVSHLEIDDEFKQVIFGTIKRRMEHQEWLKKSDRIQAESDRKAREKIF